MRYVYIHFSRHRETVFQSGGISLHSHQQYDSSTFLATLGIACHLTLAVLAGV